ncbi:unnamed protein product [Urochloa decumbens]|uniref:Protein kinase domain-containing protein n=1 Tax=Urochloa decumbens TaxID=240449 RepID=A0ABC8WJZ5_9POAL
MEGKGMRRYCPFASHAFLLLILLPSLLLFHHAPVTASPPSQPRLSNMQEAIMVNISSVVRSRRFNTTSNPCAWNGVSCTRSGSSWVVTNITLSNYGISDSSIFASICCIQTLQSLDLSRNALTDLSTQFFTSSCAMKEGLCLLNLSTNQLRHPLSDLSGFRQLEVLDLSSNFFTSTNLSTDLGSFPKLMSLNLSSNKFTAGAVPTSMVDSLVELVLSSNQLIGSIPYGLFRYENLTMLDLSQNNLTGTVPDGFKNLTKLESLLLSDNKLIGEIPASLSNVTLSRFAANQNNFTGPIPSWITKRVRMLDLSYNNLNGTIPSDFLSHLGLQCVDLTNNHLEGPIPSSLSGSFYRLRLGGNRLDGSISNSICDDTKLAYLELDNNQLTGSIPSELVALVGLCVLAVVVIISSLKRIHRVEDERRSAGEGVSQVINGRLVMNSNQISATKLTNARPDNWHITTFQALHFEVADIPHGLTEENLIGSGGSGHVYRVTYTNQYSSSTGVVAVKQIQSVAWMDEKLERYAESKLLVYDYMDNGSLDRWLHGSVRSGHSMERSWSVQHVPLDWPTRLIVAVGAAQGLCYMHHECSPPIVHRDVKASNILLDLEFRAKVADFGVARMLVRAGEPNTMSGVAGSFGYMAPECAYTRKVDEKVDVYGFGVVLLELTTGKKANDGGEHSSLAQWAEQHYRSGGSIPDATDISTRYAGYTDEIETVFRLGVKCTGNSPSSRPTMKHVLQILLKCCEQTLRKSRMEGSME